MLCVRGARRRGGAGRHPAAGERGALWRGGSARGFVARGRRPIRRVAARPDGEHAPPGVRSEGTRRLGLAACVRRGAARCVRPLLVHRVADRRRRAVQLWRGERLPRLAWRVSAAARPGGVERAVGPLGGRRHGRKQLGQSAHPGVGHGLDRAGAGRDGVPCSATAGRAGRDELGRPFVGQVPRSDADGAAAAGRVRLPQGGAGGDWRGV
mmetsp:Transcript_27394/g.92180  ORF Transcript_27394/g.92180 Transcript_27394/m.92180 type:complete len:210 (+) Transcript_27394:495-1124(+)